MVETLEIDGSSKLKDIAHKGAIVGETTVAHAAGSSLRGMAESAELFKAYGVGVAVSAGLTQLDYVQERDMIRRQFERELSAKLGKPHQDLTNKDLDKIGQSNAVIGDALKRARIRRNIGLVVGALAVAAAFAVGAPMIPQVADFFAKATGAALAGEVVAHTSFLSAAIGAVSNPALFVAVVGKALTIGAASVATFMATEKIGDAIAKPLFGMEEPSIRKVIKDPSQQDKLSLSSQMKYLEHLQKRVHPEKPKSFISQEQVLKFFLAANPGTAEAIKNSYGANYSQLPPEQRKGIIATLGKEINLEQVTTDLNTGQIRAQELAFLAQGDRSGVPRRQSPRLNALEKAHESMEAKLQQAEQEIRRLQMQVKSTQLGSMAPELNVRATQSDSARAPRPEAIGPATERLLASRKQVARHTNAGVVH